LEHVSLLLHLYRIAFKRRLGILLRESLPLLAKRTVRSYQLARYAMELIGIASPSLQKSMRKVGHQGLMVFLGLSQLGQTRQEI